MPISTIHVPPFYRMDNEDPQIVLSVTPQRIAMGRSRPTSPALQSEDDIATIAESRSGDTSGEDSDSSVAVPVPKATKIPKPKGEVGRQKRGYNLEKRLAWGQDEYRDFLTQLHELVELNLDLSRSWKAQKKPPLDQIRKIMTDRFPKLREYADSWPVDAAMQLRLKYTSEQARRHAKETRVAALEAALATRLKDGHGSSAATQDVLANAVQQPEGRSLTKAKAEIVPSAPKASVRFLVKT